MVQFLEFGAACLQVTGVNGPSAQQPAHASATGLLCFHLPCASTSGRSAPTRSAPSWRSTGPHTTSPAGASHAATLLAPCMVTGLRPRALRRPVAATALPLASLTAGGPPSASSSVHAPRTHAQLHAQAYAQPSSGWASEEAEDLSGLPFWQTQLQEVLLALPFMAGVRAERARIRDETRRARQVAFEAEEAHLAEARAEEAALLKKAADLERAEAVSRAVEESTVARRRGRRDRWFGWLGRIFPRRRKKTNQAANVQAPVRACPFPLESEDVELWRAFAEYDQNADNSLDFVELRSALEKLGLPCTPEYLVSMMEEYDLNRDQQIDWDEFKYYVHKRDLEIEKAFRQFDIDGDGEISAAELGAVLRSAGMQAADSDVRSMMSRVDCDTNATISYDEFRRFAAFLPSTDQITNNPMLYAAWWHASSTTRGGGINAARAKGYTATDHSRTFVFFDIFVRASISLSIVVIITGWLERSD